MLKRLAVSAALLSFTLLYAHDTAREEFHQTYPLAAAGRISVQNVNGAIHVAGWDRNEVKLDAVKRGQDEYALKEAKIVVEAQADSIAIRTKYPDNCHDCHPASVEYTLTVPRHAILDHIDAVNGQVTIDGVAGQVTAKSVNGSVIVRGAGADSDLSSVNGAVELEAPQSTARRISMHTVNGAISVGLPGNLGAHVTASTVHGGIHSDFDLPVQRPRYGPGASVDSTIGNGGVEISLKTVNGPIRLSRR
jgi:hypothetical protein